MFDAVKYNSHLACHRYREARAMVTAAIAMYPDLDKVMLPALRQAMVPYRHRQWFYVAPFAACFVHIGSPRQRSFSDAVLRLLVLNSQDLNAPGPTHCTAVQMLRKWNLYDEATFLQQYMPRRERITRSYRN